MVAAAIIAAAIYLYSAFASSPSPVAPASPPSDAAVTVLTPQSYPLLGGLWTVEFATSGTAGLSISAVNGTSYGTDLEFVSISCGDSQVAPELVKDSGGNLVAIAVKGWDCDNRTAHHTVKVLTAGKHAQQLTFGGQPLYAYNYLVEVAG